MMHAFRFLEKSFLIVAKFANNCQKLAKNGKKENILLHTLPQKFKILEMQKLAQT